jgi:hypothetical protein
VTKGKDEMKRSHKATYLYRLGRVRLQCSCGHAATKWVPDDTPAPELQSMLSKAHPRP